MMTILITGASIQLAQAQAMATIERFSAAQQAGRPHFYFNRFCLDQAVAAIFRDNMAFVSTSDFLSQVVERVAAAHAELDVQKHAWRGRTPGNYIRFAQIPLVYQAAVRNLIDNNNPFPGHDRGPHTTNPGAAGAGTAREYDLSASRDGRLTIRTQGGRRAFYYSRHHAAATYEYLLITDNANRPIFRGNLPPNLMRVPV
ncbi:hypothetical protein QWZ03_16355 [Chitinimonas viridis]|uniref:Uncharacterized protein n=1 Tax=Chitinimonas viridis TaxID=664880 RepID=A0ABT8B7W3_9NEIS|nr:hypothetical protein [Chitinimonas viridis]MDN3578342.1 hypothetical protein [Chitinimonas viridis]